MNVELPKFASEKLLVLFVDIIQVGWQFDHVPKQRNVALISLIFKKDDKIVKITQL